MASVSGGVIAALGDVTSPVTVETATSNGSGTTPASGTRNPWVYAAVNYASMDFCLGPGNDTFSNNYAIWNGGYRGLTILATLVPTAGGTSTALSTASSTPANWSGSNNFNSVTTGNRMLNYCDGNFTTAPTASAANVGGTMTSSTVTVSTTTSYRFVYTFFWGPNHLC